MNERSFVNGEGDSTREISISFRSAEQSAMANENTTGFTQLSRMERLFNRTYGIVVGLGLGFAHNYLLETRGRKTGRVYSTPVNLLEMNGRRYLCASRGETAWVKNARAAESIVLAKGSRRDEYRVRELPVQERAPMLKEFLERYASSVQRFYPVPKGSPIEAFADCAHTMPVFELIARA
jgi:deazaflavin-dependent oxidoreductase (nitroreductase family)